MNNYLRPFTFTFIVLLLVIGPKCNGHTNIQIIIKDVGNHKINKVDVFDLSQKEFFEVAYKDTLNFSFNKENIDCFNIRYHENDKIYRQQIWLNFGQIKIEAHIDSTKLKIDSVYNSPVYYKHLNFSQDYSLLSLKKDTTKLNNMLLDLYSNNIDNPYSFVFANSYILLNQNSKNNLNKLKIMTDRQGDKFKWFLLYSPVVSRLNEILTLNTVNLNDYNYISRENRIVKLSNLNKKYYIFDFWFLNCAPCIKDHKEIENKLKYLDYQNAEIISISTDTNTMKWNAYLNKNNYNWQNYLETKTKNITGQLKINTFPTYLITDNIGHILNTQNSFSEVLNWLDKK